MTTTITLNADQLNTLDLSPVETILNEWQQAGSIATHEQEIRFELDYPRDATDPRELSEIPEIRLWFVRLDARYPWLPILLNWESGELARYAAMLVPHQFSPEGIQFNPEALEIFMMHKVFVLMDWMKQQGNLRYSQLKFMTQMLGYELDDGFFEFLGV
ncbi:CRR6 family NdhI maturation factor [Thermocoleostomius sinensis]|uniref:CRR6 family NdhI maturation factor n=1 Tax=Thermocoleostomius sinensis A174 TaxID=2016057 RepID=A0A9E8ZFV2_9CYAN|nr:CRR6 family NdhI maturation factor [Thermocoleostomius sinensis]WAL61064.1 CRR6 family NdhI maturation factor [Thermocoleostomius sinensis A174]